jgi:biopolymer transport protein ExbD
MKTISLFLALLVTTGLIHAQQPVPSSTTPNPAKPAQDTGVGGGYAAAQPGTVSSTDLYGAGLLSEEAEQDLAGAEAAYRQAIQQFDRQREGAANAIFRLGEVYRKMGRTEEAKVQYARILREFPDMVRLTELSHAQLIGDEARTRTTGRGGSETTFVAPGLGTAASPGTEDALNRAHRVMTGRIERFGPLPGGGLTTAPPPRPQQTGRMACVENLRHLGLAARIYASEHQGAYPSTVLAMRNEIPSPEALVCPSDTERQPASTWTEFDPALHMTYEFEGDLVRETDVQSVLFRCPIHRYVTLGDGSVQTSTADTVVLQRYGLGAAATQEPRSEVEIVNAIINRLRQIDGAKQQWALEKRQPQSARPTANDIADYLRAGFPTPIAGERYELNAVGESPFAILTRPIGNRQAGEVITTEVPSETMVHQQSDPIRIHVKEDGGVELDGEPIELGELTDRLRSLILDRYPTAAARGSAVFSADDNSPQDRLLAAVDAILAATASPHVRMRVRVETQGAAQSAIQDEWDRLTKDLESFPRAFRHASQRRAHVNIEQTFLSKELEEAEARLIPARRRFEASHTSPERLPDLINKDERYQRLKAEYEASVLDKDEEAMKRAQERLTRWVEQIYRPELEAERRFAEETVDIMRIRLEELHHEDEAFQRGEDYNRQLQRELQNRLAGLKQMFPSASGAR